ncbi:hypothetical protein [Nonomuraea sp. NPDC048826]|uniref:hypothetical protein n=1 Tax=Nonomuraea sp. NPDC048826 TaxID=3364347 RepID=UPI00371810F2
MTHGHDSIPDLMQEDTFEVAMRGYNRRQVHDYMARTRNQIRDLEERLARAIDQAEQSRIELVEARRQIAEVPQNFNPSTRLEQILKLGQEEASALREEAEAESTALRESAKAESDRLLTSARETADKILTSAQAEAERRVGEATEAAERMLEQAGADAEEARTTARAEADNRLRQAQAESERMVTSAREESERLVSTATAESEQALAQARAEAERTVAAAHAEAEAALTAAQQRVAALDEHAGRRVDYLSNTHNEVVRRLNEVNSVLSDLMRKEAGAGPLVPEAIAPPAKQPQLPSGKDEDDDVRVIVEDDEPREERSADDTDVNLGRLELRK